MKPPRHWQDAVTALIGLQLACAPFTLDYQGDGAATRNAVVAGVALLATGVAARLEFRRWIEAVTAAIGLWLLISPFALGFVNVKLAAYNAEVAGGAELLLVMFALFAKDARDAPWTKTGPE
jgi:hypothetical protein